MQIHKTCKYGIMQITQVCNYTTTHRRAVSLPGDREEDRERERSIGDQLNNIISHIEVKNRSTAPEQIHKYTTQELNSIISHIKAKDISKYTNFQIQNCTKCTNFQYKRKDQLNNIISHIEVNTNMHNNTQICKRTIARRNNIWILATR